ncbi:MAG: GH13_16 / GH13_36 / GH13 / GH13_23 / GH13_ 17 / GH13_40 / GH13_31 / GH13_29 / GH13_4 / GH13 _35 / GH13_30 / GH13_20 / GH13_21 / GH13_2 / GH13 _34 / GH13_18 [uncultured Lysobacter sp.]|uniref:GH13_16 / GH13_36 / GH13 / GH13_23 / GH13_ 17 / GH13_40 / GH13_31 / GH13_29 / GH13_4 / GH13 _35 / GH13_30 / GH13_20 / GH13_21 / GH13_2 / GH13 _34 / GH13_18 n=1 Tax=uncultured Lysobacter sp. TaxID=271060 RepID=A0A6J4KN28_9GAMM|nr:MAG: GH13_16 / GH13_36 / GH13 / GH13_23 / GH13_ 17 / GH13_40 / GH13_31 / GH13_29 / GH13_4 / GH13 _35 / GH13_30 / GH13_20 / GH13_21 / GH13_2 / GH13 _34 / GH13_18 [uncultured Lysobacter sp.]
MEALWHKNSTIYQVDPALFKDGNGDGHGDFIGLRARLDHLRMLGADCLWLNPFYASPFRDGGYDVADHLQVDPRFGDIRDFIAMLERAAQYGIRVLLELVVQHTSDQHLWFQDARHHRRSKYRDYYVWSDEPVDTDFKPAFPDVEPSVWTWDEQAQQFYRHVFYAHEPDLNIANPLVRDEIRGIMGYWLRLGVSGFRVDAAPYMAMQARAADAREDGLWWLNEMKAFAEQRSPRAILMGEADVGVHRYSDFFDEGRRLTWLLDFWLNNHAFLAFARGEAQPLVDAIAGRAPAPGDCSHAGWLRNHDQLDLDQLEPNERDEVLAAFAPEPAMRVYRHGIRRRLAPMFDGDVRRLAMAHALLFSLPGVPILRYGDEIGMGDDLSRPERLAVRTPMQWSNSPNAGFSAAPPDRLVAPVVDDRGYRPADVNVEAQLADPDSLLSHTRRLVLARQGLREITGTSSALQLDAPGVFGLRYDDAETGSSALLFTNLGAEDARFALPCTDTGPLVDVLCDRAYPAAAGDPPVIHVAGHGYRWLRTREPLLQTPF